MKLWRTLAALSAALTPIIAPAALSQPSNSQFPRVSNPTVYVPVCYMETTNGATLDLRSLCGSNSTNARTAPRNNAPANNGSNNPGNNTNPGNNQNNPGNNPNPGNNQNNPGNNTNPGNTETFPGTITPGNTRTNPGNNTNPGNTQTNPGNITNPGNTQTNPGNMNNPGNTQTNPGNMNNPGNTQTQTNSNNSTIRDSIGFPTINTGGSETTFGNSAPGNIVNPTFGTPNGIQN